MLKCLFLFILFALPNLLWGEELPRQDININRDWKFKLGDYPGGETTNFNDTTWDAINLPHSFDLPYFMAKDFYIGYGWYRKHIYIRPEWIGKRLSVEFEGAFQDAEIYLNGNRIGEHKGGFAGFSMDITSVPTTDKTMMSDSSNRFGFALVSVFCEA